MGECYRENGTEGERELERYRESIIEREWDREK